MRPSLRLFVKSTSQQSRHVAGFILVFLCASVSLHAQIMADGYSAIQFGLSEAEISHEPNVLAFRFHYVGHDLIPGINHQMGFHHSLRTGGHSPPVVHSFASFGVGSGLVNRWMTIAGFVGPSVVLDRHDRVAFDVQAEELRMGVGLAVSGSVILKPIPEIGVGLEIFANRSAVGHTHGISFVIHISNTRELGRKNSSRN